MVARRAYPGVALLDDYLYAIGGWNDNEGALNTVERLSLTTVSTHYRKVPKFLDAKKLCCNLP